MSRSSRVWILIPIVIAWVFSTMTGVVMGLQLNCTRSQGICSKVCNEPPEGLPYSGTFCDLHSGSCVCDCRNALKDECTKTPFTPCYQDCVRKNPNPEAYLYTGGNCPVPRKFGIGGPEVEVVTDLQCACECRLREDYYETNDIYE